MQPPTLTPRRLRTRPLVWAAMAGLSTIAFMITFFLGLVPSGLDVRDACTKAGETYDSQYRSENWKEPGRFFPLHNKCNASYDTVPAWVNPALVVFAVLAVAFLAAFIVVLTNRIANRSLFVSYSDDLQLRPPKSAQALGHDARSSAPGLRPAWHWTAGAAVVSGASLLVTWTARHKPTLCAGMYPSPANCTAGSSFSPAVFGAAVIIVLFVSVLAAGATIRPERRAAVLRHLVAGLCIVAVIVPVWTIIAAGAN